MFQEEEEEGEEEEEEEEGAGEREDFSLQVLEVLGTRVDLSHPPCPRRLPPPQVLQGLLYYWPLRVLVTSSFMN